jgi:branched-chain amino acid transport system permease protein
VVCAVFPASRALLMAVALAVLLGLGLWLWRSRTGWVIQAALTHPQMVQALGHDVPRLWVLVFGVGCALAALAGVLGGATFVTEPAMAATMGPLVFVVLVVGGLGSVAGALWASLLIGLLQTVAVAYDRPLPLWNTSLAQWAPLLPYVLLVLVLALRPRGLMGQRE